MNEPGRAPRIRVAFVVAVAILAAASGTQAREVTRVRALATFDLAWTIIHETHFDPTFNGVDWEALRRELRPRARRADTMEDLRAVLRDMVGRLQQSHFAVIPGEEVDRVAAWTGGGGGDVGLELRTVEGRPTVWRVDPDGPAAAANVRTGWIPVAVAGLPVDRMRDEVGAYAGGVGRPPEELLPELLERRLLGSPGSTVTASFETGDGETVDVPLTRRPIPGRWIQFGNLPPMLGSVEVDERVLDEGAVRIGILRVNVWMVPLMADIDAAVDRFRGHDGIVLDLRGNPGGVGGMVAGVAGHFLDDRVSLGTLRGRDAEMRFLSNPRRVDTSGRRVEPYAGPLAILIDRRSASTSEVFAAGMRDIGRARLFGTRSAGAALPALMDRLPSGDVLYHAVADYRAPSGAVVEGRGVNPDVAVPPTRRGLLDGRDAAMEAAEAWIVGLARAGRDAHPGDASGDEGESGRRPAASDDGAGDTRRDEERP